MPRTKWPKDKVPPELMDRVKVLQMFIDIFNLYPMLGEKHLRLLSLKLIRIGQTAIKRGKRKGMKREGFWSNKALREIEAEASQRCNWSSNKYLTERVEHEGIDAKRMITGKGAGGSIRSKRTIKGKTQGTRLCPLCDRMRLKKELKPWGVIDISICKTCKKELTEMARRRRRQRK